VQAPPGKRLKYARVERERRFLLAALPPGVDPQAGYLQFEDLYFPATSLRLRRVTAPDGRIVELKLNQKLPHETERASHRVVTSVYLGVADYDLLAGLPGERLVKRRYGWVWRGVRFGVDAFQERLAELVLAEAEGETEEALAALPPLSVPHVEVTEDSSFGGGALASADAAAVLARAAALLARAP